MIQRNRIAVTRLDHTKSLVKHYTSIHEAMQDTLQSNREIQMHIKEFSMDRYRSYWMFTGDYERSIGM